MLDEIFAKFKDDKTILMVAAVVVIGAIVFFSARKGKATDQISQAARSQ